jgi:soluble lytic murein transglycosylase
VAEVAARRALAARPRGPASSRAALALGLALLARGAHEEAAEALETALAAPGTPARGHVAFARGEALLAAGDAPRAARLFAEAAAAGELAVAREARFREADALIAAGLAAEAVPALEELLRALPEHPRAPAARLALARGLRETGEDARAAEAYRALWLELPERPEGRAAGAVLERWRAAAGPVPPPRGDEELARAERLLASGWPDAALLAVALGRQAEPPAEAERAEVLRALALVARSQHREAEQLALPLRSATDEGVRRGALLVLARAAARAGRLEEASRRYEEVAALRAPVPGLPEFRQRDLADETAYLAAWLFYDAGDFARGAEELDRFARANPRSRRFDDARWFAAWSRYRLGRKAEAARGFARLARTPYADAAAYWRARLAAKPAARRTLYREAVRASGDGWYALLARARLAELGETGARAPPPDARPLAEADVPAAAARLAVAVELLGLGLRSDALDELADLSRSWRVRPAAAAVAQLAAFAGDAEIPFRMARDHLARTRRTVRWSHPEPYPELVPSRARAFDVDPALLLAVMRRESSFRPAIRSGAGAEGLLQLRPATAERLAMVAGLPVSLAARLAEPEVNVALGAHYLGLLVGRFGDPAVALAAYNAGPAPVVEWARARAGMPLDAWVESIPFRETRGYLKIVLADWDLYRALQGSSPAPLDPAKPVRPAGDGVAF